MDFPFDFFGRKTLKKLADAPNPNGVDPGQASPSSINLAQLAQENAQHKLAPMTGSSNAVKSVTPTATNTLDPNKKVFDNSLKKKKVTQ